MSIQATVGSSGLIAAGISFGDVATLYTLGRRVGNWITAENGDKELLAQLEEDELSVLQRRGLIDITRFQKRWDCRLRLLENNKPRRITGRSVEELLRSKSQWTVMMICVVAALDEFASSSMVRSICKALLHRLFPSQDGIDMTEDVLNSNLGMRIEAWRSAGTVREMNVSCRSKRNDLMKEGLVVQGFMPVAETAEVVEFLHWLIAQDSTEMFRTSSSDIAAIGCCLSSLSFESLTVENFGRSSGRETNCRLIYDSTPLYNGYGVTSQDGRRKLGSRELSTVVSLTQPEETFSTFPITHAIAQKCRLAWERGSDAGKYVALEGNNSHTWEEPPSSDLTMCFTNKGTSVTVLRGRKDPKAWSLVSLLAIFASQEVCDILTEVVGRESPDAISQVVRVINTPDSDPAALDDPDVRDTFTVCQAFFMGYYYSIFSAVVDTSTLEVQTVSGHWGYRSPEFLNKMAQFLRRTTNSTKTNRISWEVARTHVLSLVANLYANIEINIPKTTSNAPLNHQETCVGVIGKRIILTNSLLNNCQTVEDILRFVILDCDAGGIPHTPGGLVLTGIPPRRDTWEGETPPTATEIAFSGPDEDCTRHIEADWDAVPEHLLLCIRYKGRRVGSLNPAYADIAFFRADAAARQVQHARFFERTPSDTTVDGFVGAHPCELDDFTISGRLVTPGRHDPNKPVAVHTAGSPCFRYAANAWYTELGDTVFVDDDNFGQAFENWSSWKNSSGLARNFVTLIGTYQSERAV
ncbi:hypothetical protein B0H67DRAFT_567433 [Lasiosphaeris hirsuta]|uniref:Uncharacterized protein n=1 Tax=Lasiosphaeris hirsuta TaxID=260670 RepID=A0AA40AY69_9PEZI|nr:hypothetical protein B0H67DRAFT_567433 [Lasiosphaeris hirsuta]